MFKISIPKPCFEGWENMLPNDKGRYCNACAKTVVDFSAMSDEVVEQYFISNYGTSICGRFKNTQLQRIVISLPQNIFHIQLPFWKKFLVAFLICFGGSFLGIDTTMAGPAFSNHDRISYSSNKITDIKTDKKKHGHVRKKKNRRRINKNLTIEFPRIIYSGGYVAVERQQPPASCLDSIYMNALEQRENTGAVTALKNKINSTPSQKSPSPKIPDPNTAFILPAIFAARNSFSKKKKA